MGLAALAAVGLLGAAAMASVPACSSCNHGKAPLALVPADALGVVVVPSIDEAMGRAKRLADRFGKGLISGALLDKQSSAIRAELGFDPRKPETMRKVGIDPGRGLVVAFGHDGAASVVVGVHDQGALDAYLRQQVQKALAGSAKFAVKTVSGVKLTAVAARGKDDLSAWTYTDKNLVAGWSREGGAAARVAQLTRLDRSIADNPTFRTAQKRIGEYSLLVYLDGEASKRGLRHKTERALHNASDWMKRYVEERRQTSEAALSYFSGLALGLQIEPEQVALRTFYAAPEGKAKILRSIFSGVGDGLPLGKFIAPDALVVGRAALNLSQALEKALEILPSSKKRRIYRQLERIERENNISLDKDVLSQLGGRFAGALYAPPSVKPSLPRSAAGAARMLPVVLMAQVRDSQRIAGLLDRLERYLVMKGMDIRPRSEGERKIFTLQVDSSPIASWTVTDRLLVIASGERLEPTLALIDKGGQNVLSELPGKRARAALKQDEGLLLTANIDKIGAAIRGLDLGMDARLMLAPVFGALGKFRDVTLTLEFENQGLVADLEVTLGGSR